MTVQPVNTSSNNSGSTSETREAMSDEEARHEPVRSDASAGQHHEDSPRSPHSSPRRITPPRSPAKRHRHNKARPFWSVMHRNYSRAAFNRVRDRLSCKSARTESRDYWMCLYQASVNRMLWTSILLAQNQRKKTITRTMVENAFHSAMSSASKRLYTLDA